jgi:hypothetical protein
VMVRDCGTEGDVSARVRRGAVLREAVTTAMDRGRE